MVNTTQTVEVRAQDLAPLEIAIGQVPMSNGLIVEGLIQRLGHVIHRMMPDDLGYVEVKVLNEENALTPDAEIVPYRANAMVRRISLRKGSLTLAMLLPVLFLTGLCIWGFVVYNNARDRLRKDDVAKLGEAHRDCLIAEARGPEEKKALLKFDSSSWSFNSVKDSHRNRKDLESELRQLGADRIVYTRKDSVEDFEISVEFSDGTRLDVRASDLHKPAPRKGEPQVGPSGRPMN